MYNNRQDEVLRLLNQIASDMVKRSDVDAMIAAAVKEAVDRVNEEHERKMKAMAAEYEAKIAALEKKNGNGGNKGGKGNAGARKKSGTETYATKEDAIAALEEALKFEDKTGIAVWFLDRIKPIYKFEKRYKKDRLSPEAILENRKSDILPILGEILQKLNAYANDVTGECGSLLMKAIHYAQAERKGLVRYTTDGRYRPDNNFAEAIMKDFATGRKNFLFSGSDESAQNLAFAYSLTQSCKLCGINPYDYWEDLLTNAYNPNRTKDSFMPHLWQKLH